MRTREEQITELTEMLYEAGYRFQNKAKPEAERIILEAEHRAEQRVRAEIEANLKDQSTVHVNMLRGSIATPTWEQFLHLFPEKQAEIGRDSERLDWLTDAVSSIGGKNGDPVVWKILFTAPGQFTGCEHFRAAIDAAREVG